MPLRELEHLFEGSLVRNYKKGQIILYPGGKLSHIYYVRRGYVKMYSINDLGDERVYMIFPPKTAFPILPNGIDAETYELRYFYQAITSTEMFQITRQQFMQVLEKNEEAANLVLDYVTQLAGELVRRLGIIENKDARSKISNVLRYLIKVAGQEINPQQYELRLKTTHQELASLAGLTRETASVQIKQLEHDKVIEQKRGRNLIINEHLLSD